MTQDHYQWQPEPGTLPPPGEIIDELLTERGWSQSDLARKIGVTPAHVNKIIRHAHGYSAELALKIAGATGTSPRFWMHLLADYELNQAEARVLSTEEKA
jgi:addiction module HigA family antidote